MECNEVALEQETNLLDEKNLHFLLTHYTLNTDISNAVIIPSILMLIRKEFSSDNFNVKSWMLEIGNVAVAPCTLHATELLKNIQQYNMSDQVRVYIKLCELVKRNDWLFSLRNFIENLLYILTLYDIDDDYQKLTQIKYKQITSLSFEDQKDKVLSLINRINVIIPIDVCLKNTAEKHLVQKFNKPLIHHHKTSLIDKKLHYRWIGKLDDAFLTHNIDIIRIYQHELLWQIQKVQDLLVFYSRQCWWCFPSFLGLTAHSMYLNFVITDWKGIPKQMRKYLIYGRLIQCIRNKYPNTNDDVILQHIIKAMKFGLNVNKSLKNSSQFKTSLNNNRVYHKIMQNISNEITKELQQSPIHNSIYDEQIYGSVLDLESKIKKSQNFIEQFINNIVWQQFFMYDTWIESKPRKTLLHKSNHNDIS